MAISVTVNLTVLFRSFGNLPRRSGLGQDQDRCRQRSHVASMQTPASTVLTLTKLRSWRLEQSWGMKLRRWSETQWCIVCPVWAAAAAHNYIITTNHTIIFRWWFIVVRPVINFIQRKTFKSACVSLKHLKCVSSKIQHYTLWMISKIRSVKKCYGEKSSEVH